MGRMNNKHLETLDDIKSTHSNIMTIPFPPRNIWKGSIREGDGWVEKDYGANPSFSRLYGRICLHWEIVALKRLKGIEGIPRYLCRPTSNSIRMSRLPGTVLTELKAGELSETCFRKLQELVHEMHSRGDRKSVV